MGIYEHQVRQFFLKSISTKYTSLVILHDISLEGAYEHISRTAELIHCLYYFLKTCKARKSHEFGTTW